MWLVGVNFLALDFFILKIVHLKLSHCSYSIQFSHSVVSDSLWPRGLQHTGPPCPSPTPRACSNSCPSSRWCHPTISSSVTPLSSSLQSFLASRSFPMSQFFASGDQSIGASVSASVLPMNIQDWFPLGWTALISLQSKGLSRVFSNTAVQNHQFFSAQLYSIPVNLLKTYKANVILCSTTSYLCVNGKVHLKVRVLRRGHLVYFRLRDNILACVLSRLSHVWFFVTLWTVAHQAPLSGGFSRQEHWSGSPCLPPGALPDPETEPVSLSLHW